MYLSLYQFTVVTDEDSVSFQYHPVIVELLGEAAGGNGGKSCLPFWVKERCSYCLGSSAKGSLESAVIFGQIVKTLWGGSDVVRAFFLSPHTKLFNSSYFNNSNNKKSLDILLLF